jgi:POT family proton-dependent oligopeptide transporter
LDNYIKYDPRRDAGFSFFLHRRRDFGHLIGVIYVQWRKVHFDVCGSRGSYATRWNVGFGFAAIVMISSLLTFTQTQKNYKLIGLSPLVDRKIQKKKVFEIGTTSRFPL